MEKKKKIIATTTLVQARVSKELLNKFRYKCKEFVWQIDQGLIKLIEEWVS